MGVMARRHLNKEWVSVPWVPSVVPDHLVALGKLLQLSELQFC